MSSVVIRRAESHDREAVFHLAKAFATSFAVERLPFETSFAALIQSSDAFLAVALEQDELVGYILGFDHVTLFANGRVSWVEEIMVAEAARRHGIGHRLMDAFEHWSRTRDSKLVGLATRRAAPFYRSLGYEESAIYFRRLL